MIAKTRHIKVGPRDAIVPGKRHSANPSTKTDPEKSDPAGHFRVEAQQGGHRTPEILDASTVNVRLGPFDSVKDVPIRI
jgi:hypothetical protein